MFNLIFQCLRQVIVVYYISLQLLLRLLKFGPHVRVHKIKGLWLFYLHCVLRPLFDWISYPASYRVLCCLTCVSCFHIYICHMAWLLINAAAIELFMCPPVTWSYEQVLPPVKKSEGFKPSSETANPSVSACLIAARWFPTTSWLQRSCGLPGCSQVKSNPGLRKIVNLTWKIARKWCCSCSSFGRTTSPLLTD